MLDVVVESDVERARLLLETKEITARAAARESGSGDAAEVEAALQDAVRTQEVQYMTHKVYSAWQFVLRILATCEKCTHTSCYVC